MKLKNLLCTIIFLIFILVACTNEPIYDETTDQIETDYETVDESMAEPADLYPMIHLTEEARDLVLEDFDYLVKIILENAPSQVIFERRFDILLEDRLAEMRETIYNMEPIMSMYAILMGEFISSGDSPIETREFAARYLSTLLLRFAMNIEGLGHLGPRDLQVYLEQLEDAAAVLHQGEIIDGQLVINGEIRWDARLEQLRFDAFTAKSTLWFFDVNLDNLDLYRELSDIGFRQAGNVRTEIIEENRIAYLHLSHFGNSPAFDSEILFPFFEEVQDFEHLIIDLRGNGGGLTRYFPNYIVAMLIDEPIEVRKNEFFMDGDRSYQLAEYSLASWFGSADEILLAREFVEEHDFPYFNKADLDILTHVISWKQEIVPRADNIPFAGKIWILVDSMSGSAAEVAAHVAIDSGFATVIGTPTAGVTGTMHMYIPLPNTGVLFRIDTGYTIDAYGRSLEEFGVTPQIVIPRGGDALREVLNLIDAE